MAKLWLVAKREYLHNIRRRGFLFAAFGVPLFTIAAMAVVFMLAVENETDASRVGNVGYVDHSGVVAEAINKPETFVVYESEDEARAALDAREIGAYFVIAEDYMQNGLVTLYSASDTPEALTDAIDSFLLANLSTDLDPEIAQRIEAPVDMLVKTLNNGRVISENGTVGLVLAPIIFVMVFMLGTQTTSGYLMSGVVEEKTNRIMEILVTSVTPFQLLFGKILGLGALGLTQLAAWVVIGSLALTFGEGVEVLAGVTIPPDMLVVGLIYFLLGYFMLASLMAGIGAVIGSEQESRQWTGIFSLISVIPFFLITEFFLNPDGFAVVFLTLFPLTSPVAVILRMGFGSVPLWQLVASIALLLVTTLVIVWAAARIFRWSLLMYGKHPTPRQIINAVFRSRGMATTAAGEHTA